MRLEKPGRMGLGGEAPLALAQRTKGAFHVETHGQASTNWKEGKPGREDSMSSIPGGREAAQVPKDLREQVSDSRHHPKGLWGDQCRILSQEVTWSVGYFRKLNLATL